MSKTAQLRSSFSKKNESPTNSPKSSTPKKVSFNIPTEKCKISKTEKLTTNELKKEKQTILANQISDKPKSVPPSAYEIFCFENSDTIKMENPNVPEEDFRQLLATSWKELTKNEKEVFQERSMKLWRKHDKQVKKLKRKVQEKPLSGYKLFVEEIKEQFKDLAQRDFKIKCGESWNELTLEQQEDYLKRSLQLWKDYDKGVKECEFEFY
eukprot:gene6698-10863_t